MERAVLKGMAKDLVPGLAVFLTAAPLIVLIQLVNDGFPTQPEHAVRVVGGVFIALLALPPGTYLLARGKSTDLARLGFMVLTTASMLLVAIYLYWVSFYVLFPADILIWSESDFINDILKLRLGYPLYSAQANNESFIYTPGTPTLTYVLAWLSGHPTCVPVYRMIQLGYTFLAAIVAVLCCRTIVDRHASTPRSHDRMPWGAVWLSFFFLLATNSLTNPFVHNLHNDALAQLSTVVAYWLLLQYTATRSLAVLALMAIVPAAGFLVKQSLGIWALLYCVHLAFFDRPNSTMRAAIFAVMTFSGMAVVLGSCYLLWGEHFVYWVFTVLGHHPRSILRSFQHVLDGWAYLSLGLVGGYVLLRGKRFPQLVGAWVIWFALFLLEGYTSGIAWMRNHMGPGSLLAGIWFAAAVARLWPLALPSGSMGCRPRLWLRGGIFLAIVGLAANGLGIVRVPVKPFPDDAYRYTKDIEEEFAGAAVADVLLDAGTWVYLKEGIVMQDRVPSFGDRGYGDSGDFSGMLQRLEHKRYAKILVRNLHSPDFWYDHRMWRKSSQIKRTLLEHYREVGGIRAVSGQGPKEDLGYLFSDISILVPNPH
jgi:hypothetical protein